MIEAIAAHFGVRSDRVRLGSGSDTLMMYTTTVFAGPGDEVVFSARGYSRYARNALIAGATPVAARDHDRRGPGRLLRGQPGRHEDRQDRQVNDDQLEQHRAGYY